MRSKIAGVILSYLNLRDRDQLAIVALSKGSVDFSELKVDRSVKFGQAKRE